MKSTRQLLLVRRMRRSLIALRMQTPQPVIQRIPNHWYFSVVAVLVVLTALISTRAALMFRTEFDVTQARVVYVQKENLERRQARVAALIDYQRRPKRVEVIRLPDPEPVVAEVVKPQLVTRHVVERAVVPAKPQITISSRYAEEKQSLTTEDAFRRLTQAEDTFALSWLLNSAEIFRDTPAWERFQQATAVMDSPLRAYQIGVLFGALGEDLKAYRWSASAASSSNKPHYIRAHAVAADRLGKREEAAQAYRRYLAVSPAVDVSQIVGRLAVLESQ